MPVTFFPSTQPLTSINTAGAAHGSISMLHGAVRPELTQNCHQIFQSSFDDIHLRNHSILPSSSGFVRGAIEAYKRHHHLVIRPDDVWITILTQLSIYVNANAEDLRHLFVKHEGKKTLTVNAIAGRFTVNVPDMVQQMTHLIQENVIDPDLRTWMIPDFTTTTPNDRIVSSIVMMATLKKYFNYEFEIWCGLPGVTLLGEKEEWIKLTRRIEKLPSFGNKTAQWCTLLKPVLLRFVAAFDHPDSKANLEFWQQIVDEKYEVSGCTGSYVLSGWITAFMFFDDSGRPMHGSYASGTVLDGVPFHQVYTKDIPPGYAEVNVKLNDNGTPYKAIMVAGVVGYSAADSRNVTNGHSGNRDVLQPVSGWWLFEEKELVQDERLRDGNRYNTLISYMRGMVP